MIDKEFLPKPVYSAEEPLLLEPITVTVSSEELREVISNPNHTADDVFALFIKDFGHLFQRPAGVIEGYTLGQHTRMVLKQYHKYFKETHFPEGTDGVFFETIIALHDIGKPEASEAGEIDRQYVYHETHLVNILPQLGFTDEQVKIAISLISSDPIREYLYKHRTDAQFVVDSIKRKAEASGLELKDFWHLLKLIWMCDAGSYTVDAGGKASLDRMFVFEPDEGEMHLAPHMQKYFESLEKALFEEYSS
jgi:hypothetical protein